MRLSDEKITDIKEYLNRSMKVTASSLIPQLSKYGIDLIDTIEALQQENEQLRAQVARMREALRKARETISARDSWFECDRCANMRDALAEIDKAIGGKEDV
jgi:phage shock protein A